MRIKEQIFHQMEIYKPVFNLIIRYKKEVKFCVISLKMKKICTVVHSMFEIVPSQVKYN